MKQIHVSAIFRQATGSKWNQSKTVKATSIPLGVKRCLDELFKRPGIKGLRHKTISLEIIVPRAQPSCEMLTTEPPQ